MTGRGVLSSKVGAAADARQNPNRANDLLAPLRNNSHQTQHWGEWGLLNYSLPTPNLKMHSTQQSTVTHFKTSDSCFWHEVFRIVTRIPDASWHLRGTMRSISKRLQSATIRAERGRLTASQAVLKLQRNARACPRKLKLRK